mgnify:FL=1|tara:strand:+ start:51 stop:581 length:531 start_codon:yes stop_codon:yes gene_type:complete
MIESPTDQLSGKAGLPGARQEGDIAQCRSPVCLRLIHYWQGLATRNNGHPEWAQVRLIDLYKIATFLAVKDVIDGGTDFLNRFWGTGLTDALGFEGTNRRVSSYEPASMRDAVHQRYVRVTRTGEPEMVRGYIATIPGQEHVPYEVVHLPLWGEGGGVRQIISAYQFGFVAEADEA